MSKQALFDKAYQAVVKQGRPSLRMGKNSSYRGENNCKCAIGHLLPDSIYEPWMEDLTIRSLWENSHPRNSAVRAFFSPMVSDVNFFVDLQKAHDRATEIFIEKGGKKVAMFMAIFHSNMRKLARKHKLEKKYFG